MADKKLNEVPVVSDIVTIFGKRSNGEIVQIDKSNLATLLGGLMNSLGLFPFMFRGVMTNRSYNDLTETGYYKIQENMVDGPSTYWGTLVVFNDGDQITQVFYPNIDSTEISTRKGSINNFVKSAWRIIPFTQNKP